LVTEDRPHPAVKLEPTARPCAASTSPAVPLACHSHQSRPVTCGQPRTTQRQLQPASLPDFAGNDPGRSGFGSKGSTFRRSYRTIASSATRSTMTIGVPGTTEVMQMQLQRRPSGLPDWLYLAIVGALACTLSSVPSPGRRSFTTGSRCRTRSPRSWPPSRAGWSAYSHPLVAQLGPRRPARNNGHRRSNSRSCMA
jgi:hypothetical protein